MADGGSVTATVTVPLSGTPAAGLRIRTDGSAADVPADWSKDVEAASLSVGARVSATLRTPSRPLVTGLIVQGVAS